MRRFVTVAIPRPVEGLFSYEIPTSQADSLAPGAWVRVPFGKSTTHAYVVRSPYGESELPAGLQPDKIREVLEVGSQESVFPPDVWELCRWVSEYYEAPLGEVLNCAAPAASLGLRNAKREARPWGEESLASPVVAQLTEEQLDVVAKLRAVSVGVIEGVTGSGKTEVYLQLAREVLAQGKSVLILVPEIALTPQLHRRIEAGLGCSVGLWHSAQADGARRDLASAARSGQVRALIGARSAVFAPLLDLGLIIVDEEHDTTYKQEDRVRYNARDVAIVRGKLCTAPVILGSATPSLETRERVREGKYVGTKILSRFGPATPPTIETVALCEEPWIDGMQAPVAERTLTAIRETLAAGEQVMVFLNRRGFAAFLVCTDCAWVPHCPDCSISLSVYKKRSQLRCHVCGHAEPIPDTCETCQGSDLEASGAGTESLEEQLPALLPEARIGRLDRDQVTSVQRLESVLESFRTRETNLLLGTQMLVKGHDFPGVTLVVVMLADALFRWPDFRAPERAYQTLLQVAGRAGRGERPGRVLIQTYDPEHPVLQTLLGVRTESDFLESEREQRQVLNYPPFGRLARLRFESPDAREAQVRAEALARSLEAELPRLAQFGEIVLLGPSEAFLERAKGISRWDIVLRSKSVRSLHAAVRISRDFMASRRWPLQVDVDPLSL